MHTTARLDAAIYVESLSVIAGKGRDRRQLLAHLSTAIPESSFVSVIGASGCGKSTFLRALAGIQPISSGRVLLAGHEVQSLRQHLPLAVGYLPQFGAFHGDLTVAEILDYAVALRLPASVPRATREQWCQHIIDLARIRPFLPQKYRTLSGGQMRRIALAEELIGDPAFLLLDELTSGLDAYSEHELMVWLRELAHGLKKTVVLVTHAVTNLELCDSIIFLHEGRLCYQGPYPGLLETHHSPSIEAIFGAYQEASMAGTFHGFDADRAAELPPAPEPYALNTAPPPGSLRQLVTLVRRQTVLLLRDRAQLILQFILLFTFPALVALFGYKGLPQVERLSLTIDPNMRRQGAELIEYLHQSGAAAALVSGLSMFQVILLTLIGANNGAREIAKEREVLEKELRAGLSAWSYVTTKGLLDDLVRQDDLPLPRQFSQPVRNSVLHHAGHERDLPSDLVRLQIAGTGLAALYLSGRFTAAAFRRGPCPAGICQHDLPSLYRRLLGLERLPQDDGKLAQLRHRPSIDQHLHCGLRPLPHRPGAARHRGRRDRLVFRRPRRAVEIVGLTTRIFSLSFASVQICLKMRPA
jgi:ABC-type multidrug transport system ATPase subunit